MNFTKEKIKDFYLLDSKIENIFINEYMPAAPGEFVKVFLYAYMYAEHGVDMTGEAMAKQLGVSEKQVMEAWEYWEKMGAIRKHYMGADGNVDFTVEFLSLKELLYGKNTSSAKGEKAASDSGHDNVFGNKEVKKTLTETEKALGRPLSSTEIGRILSWMSDSSATPEVVLFAVRYCADKNKKSINYIEKVVKEWAGCGYTSVDQVQEHIQELDEQYYRYRRVFKALGFSRNPTEAEIKTMGGWFDVMGYSMERVLEACEKTAGISSPNINYVNKVLENWRNKADSRGIDVNKSQVVTRAVLNRYYDYLRETAQKESEERKVRVYGEIPRIKEIDASFKQMGSQLSKALILGTSEEESKKISSSMEQLSRERAALLTEHNLEMDYTDIKYQCEKCSDTGITDLGEPCSCVKQRMEEAETWIKRNDLKK